MASTARQPEKPTARRPELGRAIRWTIWFGLVVVVLIRIPDEVGYWLLAAAEKASLEGKTEDALAWVKQARPWMPESMLPKNLETLVLKRAGRIDEFERVDMLLQDARSNAAKARLHWEKSQLYRNQQKWDAALREFDVAADFQAELRPSLPRLELLLLAGRSDEAQRELAQVVKQLIDNKAAKVLVENTKAYFSALLNEDLDEALKLANSAVESDPNNPAILDTRGYVLFRLERHEEALPDLQRATELIEAEYNKQPLASQARKDFAVMLYHRSLVLNALGKSAEAERDSARVKELGFEPNERLF